MGFLTTGESSGRLEQDIIDIGIKQMNRKEYYELKPEAKKLLDSYAKDLVNAFKAFLKRQTFQITNMEAVGMINAGTIKIAGGTTTPAAPGAPVSILPAAPAVNTNNPSCLVQTIKFKIKTINKEDIILLLLSKYWKQIIPKIENKKNNKYSW